MTTLRSTKDQNICVELFMSYSRLHLHINDQTIHERKNLKLPYLHCYTRSISETWWVETLLENECKVWQM